MNLLDYPPPTPSLPPVPWPDRFSRSLLPFPNRLNTIAVSPCGQIALAITPALSILHPSLLFRISANSLPAPNSNPHSPSQSPNPYPSDLLDSQFHDLSPLDPDAKQARDMRPQALAHHFACRVSTNNNALRKDQETGIPDLVAVTWTPWVRGGCVLVTGEGTVVRAVEKWYLEGGWGGVSGDGWTCVPVLQQHEPPAEHPALERDVHGHAPVTMESAVDRCVRREEDGAGEYAKAVNVEGVGSAVEGCRTGAMEMEQSPIHRPELVYKPPRRSSRRSRGGPKEQMDPIGDEGNHVGIADGNNYSDQQGVGSEGGFPIEQLTYDGLLLNDANFLAEEDCSRAERKARRQQVVTKSGKGTKQDTDNSDGVVSGAVEADCEVILDGDGGKNVLGGLEGGDHRESKKDLTEKKALSSRKRRTSDSTRTRKKQREVGQQSPMTSVFPKNPILRVDFTKVWRGEGRDGAWEDFAVLGRQSDTCIYAVDTSVRFDEPSRPPLVLHKGWSAAVSCLVGITWGTKTVTLIAVGGQLGELRVYGVWLDGNELARELLWKEESNLLFGPVSSMCWGFGPPFQNQIRLAVGCGDTLAIVEWPDEFGKDGEVGDWGNPEFHRVLEAHGRLLSCVQVLMDGAVMSAGLDGELYVWRLEAEEGEEEIERNISCESVRKGDGEPVMAMERSVNGFGVVTLTCVNRRIENQEEEDAGREKNNNARRSMLGLYMQPPSYDLEEVKRLLVSTVEAVATCSKYVGEAISLWDLELFMEQFDTGEEAEVWGALQEQFYGMMQRIQTGDRGGWQRQEFNHYLRVAFAVCRLIQKAGDLGAVTMGNMEGVTNNMCAAVRSIHYEACIVSMLNTTKVGDLCLEECRALQLMCEFIEGTAGDLLWDEGESKQRVETVRAELKEWKGEGDVWATPCAVCIEEIYLPLVTQIGDATAFYCPGGDCFGRCVLTGLPCTDAVPLMCYGCDAKALLSPFAKVEEGREAGAEGRKRFGWVVEVGICPMCKGKLVPSSVEMQ